MPTDEYRPSNMRKHGITLRDSIPQQAEEYIAAKNQRSNCNHTEWPEGSERQGNTRPSLQTLAQKSNNSVIYGRNEVGKNDSLLWSIPVHREKKN